MRVELNGKVKFKEYAVFRHNFVTGEVGFIQDFDTEKEALDRAKAISVGLVLGSVFKFIALSNEEISETLDSQADELAWKTRRQSQLVRPHTGLKV